MATDALEPEVFFIPASDGVELAFAVYRPATGGPFPTLFAASPYRFDNNALPAGPQFLWRETGPIDFYVREGYAFVHLDLRGCGRSGGEFGFLDGREQQDLYDAVEWVAAQDWCTGKVGSIGQSYYCMVQWFLGAMNPPALACIGAHDGAADLYRQACYHGGIPCDFFPGYWWHQNRFINRFPERGPTREQATDLGALIAAHPLLDDFWHERSAWDRLEDIRTPLFSSGVWGKMQLHTRGNIDGFLRASGPKKLRMSAAPNAWAAASEYASEAFHRDVMLPFYDHYLKGMESSWCSRPAVEWAVRNSTEVRTGDQWPPAAIGEKILYLTAVPSRAVNSLNDGSLGDSPPEGQDTTAYSYPNPGWAMGVVGFAPGGPASGLEPARRVLTFTSAALECDLEIAGAIRATIFASSSAPDTDFFLKLSDQAPATAPEVERGINPAFEVVSRGWLRASHRAIDPRHSTFDTPRHAHDREEALVPGQVYCFEISLEPQAYLFRARHRIRLEIVNGDSPATEQLWPHFYRPDRIGTDTIHHDAAHPSCLVLPVLAA